MMQHGRARSIGTRSIGGIVAAGAILAGLLAAPSIASVPADAQTAPPPAPYTAVPLAPPPSATPQGMLQGTPQAAPAAPGTPPAAAASPPAGTSPPPLAPAPTPPQVWLQRGTAEVQALDKINARNTTLSVKVGDTARFGSLTIAVQACVVTPPDQPQDAAAYLVITDSHPGEPGFSGWMVSKDPSLSMLQNPVYDVRVTGCQA